MAELEEVLEALEEGAELEKYLVQRLRGAEPLPAAQALLKLLRRGGVWPMRLRDQGLEAAARHLELRDVQVATELLAALAPKAPPAPVRFAFGATELRLRLSSAQEASRLSGHGWRVWPGARLLAQAVASVELRGLHVLEAWV